MTGRYIFAPMRLHLIQSRELFGPPERQDELREVWKMNEGLFDEHTAFEGRPTFSQLFRMCKPGMVNYIANSDIYFQRTDRVPPEGHVWALSRYDVDADGRALLWDHRDSQDTWIVQGGPHEVDAPYPMGKAGCDNALVHALQQAGFTVTNPSKTIRTYHLHNVNYRSYLVDPSGRARGGNKIERVPPPYAFVQPTEL